MFCLLACVSVRYLLDINLFSFWIDNMEIPVIAADNLAVEKSFQNIDGQDYVIPLHGALIRDLGVVLTELYWLDDLAEASASDGQYTFFFSATPGAVLAHCNNLRPSTCRNAGGRRLRKK